MLVKIEASMDQIKFFAETGRSAFETLNKDDAIEVAIRSFNDIIKYLDSINRTHNAEIILEGKRPELRIGFKRFIEKS